MKYIIGSLIISFSIILIIIVMVAATEMKTPDKFMEYLGMVWLVLAIVMYPLARKIIR